MNKELFDHMREQMSPSPEVRAALGEKLAQPMKKQPVPWRKYGAVAACAALVIGGFSVYRLYQDPAKWMLLTQDFHHDVLVQDHPFHSYVTVEGLAGYTETAAVRDMASSTETGGSEGGDQDMGMTFSDVEAAMLDVGFTPEEVEEYKATGYRMTWAKWWKFVGQQRDSEGDDPFNLDDLKAFSQKELQVDAAAGDAPAQLEALEAYQKLMAHFSLGFPDWYGGAYIDDNSDLMVLLVTDKDPGDKSLEQKVLRWTASDKVVFGSAKYSLRYLRDLQDKVVDAMLELGLFSGCGTYESDNQLHLTLTSVTDEALAILAQLDPDDDAIYVEVGQRATFTNAVGDAASTDNAEIEDPTADEPWVDDLDGAHYSSEDGFTAHRDILELPEQKQPGIVQSVPEEDSSGMTAAYDPDTGYIYPNT